MLLLSVPAIYSVGTFSVSIDYICQKNVKELVEISVEERDDVKKSSELHQWIKIFSINTSNFDFFFLRRYYSKTVTTINCWMGTCR